MPEAPLIVFVCTANISRSPWAEARAAQLLDGYRLSSAGTMASRGRSVDPVMAETLPEGAVVHSGSKPLSRSIVADAGLLLTMEGAHRHYILEEYPAAIRKSFTLGQFVASARRAPSRLTFEDLVGWVYANRVPSAPGTDVADPYGQGRERARAAAGQLEALISELATLLPKGPPW